MGAAIALVFLLAAVSTIVVMVRRFSFNAKAGRARAHPDLNSVRSAPPGSGQP
jgi:hypothetical protein